MRVVSMPCMELFEAQSPDYRDSVIPRDVPARGRRGRRQHELVEVGRRPGDVLGIDRFGASAPGTTVLEKFGFTPDSIAARAAPCWGAEWIVGALPLFYVRNEQLSQIIFTDFRRTNAL